MNAKSFTHDDFANPVVIAVFKNTPLGIKARHVQVQMHHVTCCAQVIKPWTTADGLEMFQLMLQGPIYGRISLPANRVRQCSSLDGKCTCMPFDVVQQEAVVGAGGLPLAGGTRADAAPARSAPDGNHGEYLPERAE